MKGDVDDLTDVREDPELLFELSPEGGARVFPGSYWSLYTTASASDGMPRAVLRPRMRPHDPAVAGRLSAGAER